MKIGEKDVKDVIILLKDHDLGENDRVVNVRYISKLLSDDWGFYYTVTTNLRKTRDYADSFSVINLSEKELVKRRIDSLLSSIEGQEKSFKWRIRAKAGTKVKWYNDAEEVENR